MCRERGCMLGAVCLLSNTCKVSQGRKKPMSSVPSRLAADTAGDIIDGSQILACYDGPKSASAMPMALLPSLLHAGQLSACDVVSFSSQGPTAYQ